MHSITKEDQDQERGPFFVVEKWGRYAVLSETEIMADEGVMLASGTCYTREEAEAALRQGLQDGTYKPEPGGFPYRIE
jgi:hypothetical protein